MKNADGSPEKAELCSCGGCDDNEQRINWFDEVMVKKSSMEISILKMVWAAIFLKNVEVLQASGQEAQQSQKRLLSPGQLVYMLW